MEISLLLCLNQYWLVPRRELAKCSTLFARLSPSRPTMSLRSSRVSRASLGCWLMYNPSRLESAPSHLRVEGKVPEAWVLRKLTITIHHQVLKVVSSSDGVVAWGNIVTRTSGEQRREGTRDLSFSAELVDQSISTLGPRHNLLGVCRPSLSLLHCLPDCSFLRDLSGHDRNKSASFMGSSSKTSTVSFSSSSISVFVSSISTPQTPVMSAQRLVS